MKCCRQRKLRNSPLAACRSEAKVAKTNPKQLNSVCICNFVWNLDSSRCYCTRDVPHHHGPVRESFRQATMRQIVRPDALEGRVSFCLVTEPPPCAKHTHLWELKRFWQQMELSVIIVNHVVTAATTA